MLIHSVTPVQMLIEQPSLPQTAVRETPFGYIEGQETPQGFQMTRLNSTDLSLYLKSEYAPGSIYRG